MKMEHQLGQDMFAPILRNTVNIYFKWQGLPLLISPILTVKIANGH